MNERRRSSPLDTSRSIARVVLVLWPVLWGCGRETPDLRPIPFAGEMLVGLRFQSLDPLPIHEEHEHPKAKWYLSFDEDLCTWGYGAVAIRGGYEVRHDGTIVAQFWPEPVWEVRGTFDPQQRRLRFHGSPYDMEQPLAEDTIAAARAPDNRRLRRLLSFLKQRGFTLQQHQASGKWRLVNSSTKSRTALLELWAFPLSVSCQQIEEAVVEGGRRPDILLNPVSKLAMSQPTYRNPAGDDVPFDQLSDDNVEQLITLFRSYVAEDLPDYFLLDSDIPENWNDPQHPDVLALVAYLREQGLALKFDATNGEWQLPFSQAEPEVSVSLRAFPRGASRLQVRYWASHINLAFLVNAHNHLAMSYPPESTVGTRLKEAFLGYRGP